MNRIIFFSITLVTYILLAIHLPSEYPKSFIIKDVQELEKVLPTQNKFIPASLILLQQQQRGIFVKSYLEYYRLIGNSTYKKEFILEVSPSLFEQHRSLIGLSLLRIMEKSEADPPFIIEHQPALAARLFVGNTHFGSWNKRTKRWVFFYHLQNFFQQNLPIDKKYYSLSFYRKTQHFLIVNQTPNSNITLDKQNHSPPWKQFFTFSLFTPSTMR